MTASRAKRPNWSFRSANVVEEIYDAQEMRSQIRSFFHFSPLWRALQKALIDKPTRDVLIKAPYDWVEDQNHDDLRIVCHRGTGYSVNFKDAAIYGPRGESTRVEVKLDIEWDSGHETFERPYTISIPVDLCKEFSEEAFDAWLADLQKCQRYETAKQDVAALRELLDKYPGCSSVAQLIGNIQKSCDL